MNELYERELRNISINDVSLADYVKENYVPMSVIEDIKAEIYEELKNDEGESYGLGLALGIIDKHISRKEQE